MFQRKVASMVTGLEWHCKECGSTVTLLTLSVLPAPHSKQLHGLTPATLPQVHQSLLKLFHASCLSYIFKFQSSTSSVPSVCDHAQVSPLALTVLEKISNAKDILEATPKDTSSAFILLDSSAARELTAELLLIYMVSILCIFYLFMITQRIHSCVLILPCCYELFISSIFNGFILFFFL